MAAEAAFGEALENEGGVLVAAAGDEVLVLDAAVAVGEVDVGEAVTPRLEEVEGALVRRRGVRQIEGEVLVVAVGRIPAR